MQCWPPAVTTHSLASYEERSSRLCHAQIASRSGMMPPAGVYFDLFSSIARIAAILMWSGVGKSGSPGPKSAISTPRDFSLSASAIRSEEHTSELQSHLNLVCRLLLEKKKKYN